MRKHRIPGIALAAVVAGGLAISRPSGAGSAALASAVIAPRSTPHHSTVQTASNVASAESSTPAGGWRNVAQRLTFNTSGAVTTTPRGANVIAHRATAERILLTSAAIVDSTAIAEQERLQVQAAFITVVQEQMRQQFIAALAAQKALEEQQLAAANAAREAAAQRQAAAAAAANAAPASGGVWAALRNCESGGNYADNTGNGYYGAYQFSLATWQGLGYSGYPNQASPATQDAAAVQLQARSGWGQWPTCSRMLGL
jgi:hypothetical protein